MLNSLVIKNFRMLEDFTVSKLGRVNLIVGKNNSGKSSVLEALRIYAGNAQRELLVDIASSHDETYRLESVKLGDLNPSMPFEDLYTGRQLPNDETEIVIGASTDAEQSLYIGYRIYIDKSELHSGVEKNEISKSGFSNTYTRSEYISLVRSRGADFVTKRDGLILKKNQVAIPVFLSGELFSNIASLLLYEGLGITACSFVPTQLISVNELAMEWDDIVGTEHEETVKQAMRIILPEFENLYFVQNNNASSSAGGSQRTAKVKLPNLRRPVPLKSLGDGMLRVLQLALKLVSAKGGFLLIDEFENGLHYSVQEKIWALLFEMAEKLDIQVFATTHSWDCIESFTKVAIDNETTEGVLFRMGRSVRTHDKGKIIATVFSKDELLTMTQIDMEIR